MVKTVVSKTSVLSSNLSAPARKDKINQRLLLARAYWKLEAHSYGINVCCNSLANLCYISYLPVTEYTRRGDPIPQIKLEWKVPITTLGYTRYKTFSRLYNLYSILQN